MAQHMQNINSYKEFAKFYDFDQRKILKDDIPFYIEYAKTIEGKVLELGCGTGRVTLPLAKAGFYIHGIDLTKEMLHVLNNKLNKESKSTINRIKLSQQDMTQFELDDIYDLIMIPFRTFQLLITDDQQVNCLQKVHKHLSYKGNFIITVFYPGKLDESWTENPEKENWVAVDEKTGITYRGTDVKKKIDVKNQIIYPDLKYYITYPNGNEEVFTQELALKYYFEDQIIDLLTNNGFTIEEKYGYYDKRPIGKGSEMIFICRKM